MKKLYKIESMSTHEFATEKQVYFQYLERGEIFDWIIAHLDCSLKWQYSEVPTFTG